MAYTLEDANRLRELMRAAPDKAPNQRRMDKQAIVREVIDEIRGYAGTRLHARRGRGAVGDGRVRGDAADAQELPAADQEDEGQRRRQGAAALGVADGPGTGPRREAQHREGRPGPVAGREHRRRAERPEEHAKRVHDGRFTKHLAKGWTMTNPIFLVGGGKGGVGKSMLSMALLDYLRSAENAPLLIETDTSAPDVWKAYKNDVDNQCIDLEQKDGWLELLDVLDSES